MAVYHRGDVTFGVRMKTSCLCPATDSCKMSLRLDILKSLVLEDRNPVASRRAQAEEDPDDEYIYVVCCYCIVFGRSHLL